MKRLCELHGEGESIRGTAEELGISRNTVRKYLSASEVATWGGWGALTALLAVSMALLVNSVLYGRVPFEELIASRTGGLALRLSILLTAAWWIGHGLYLQRRNGGLRLSDAILPSLPLLLGVTIPVAAIYLSDLVNHYFYYDMVNLNRPKSAALLLILVSLSALLQVVQVEWSDGCSWRAALKKAVVRAEDPLILVFMATMGTLQGASYLDRLFDDFILRYWPVADALLSGAPYPATLVEGLWQPYFGEGGLAKHLLDLPVYPASVALSFLVVGHNVVAAYLPTLVSNIVLPCFVYLFYREVTENRLVALSLTTILVLFPPYRFYVLNWTCPDSVFFVALVAMYYLSVRGIKGSSSFAVWLLMGLLAAVTVLTRPEGMAYAGIIVVVSLTIPVGLRRKAVAVGIPALAIVSFSALLMTLYRIPWSQNWTGAFGLQNIGANWAVLSAGQLQALADGLRTSQSDLIARTLFFLALAFIGSIPLLHRPRRLAVLFIPPWLNLFTTIMVDPGVSGARYWDEIFRHLSYPIPFFVLGAGMAALAAVRLAREPRLRTLGFGLLNIALFLLVMWNIHYLSKPVCSFGDDAGNLLPTGRLNFVDLLSTHPYPLPVFSFEQVDGFWIVTAWRGSLWGYPDQYAQYFGRFDAVRSTAGTAYQTGSLYMYLAALFVALLSSILAQLKPGGRAAALPPIQLSERERRE